MARLPLKKPQGLPKYGLVAEYRFDEGSGQVLTNYYGTGNSGTLGTSTGAEASDPTWGSNGLYFATDDQVNLGQFTETNAARSQLSAFVVFQSSTSPANSTILGRFNTVTNKRCWRMAVNDEDATKYDVILTADGTVATRKSYTYSGIFTTSLPWHMLGFTFNTNVLTGYVENTTPTPTIVLDTNINAVIDASTENIIIGCDSSGARFITGTLAYALLYNRAVSASEVNQIYRYLKSKLKSRGITLS